MKIEMIKHNDLLNLIYSWNRYEYMLEIDDNNSFKGFHYFSPVNFDYYAKEDFIVAFNENSEIIGVLAYGWYGFKNEEKYRGFSFIDVRMDYRNKGVSKELIKELSKQFKKDDSLTVSKLSNDGRNFHVLENIKKFINCKIIYY